MRTVALLLTLVVLVGSSASASLAQTSATITIRNHRFEPSEVKVSAGKRIILHVVNDDPTPEEFESHPLKVEKVIPGKSRARIRIGPLAKGRYPFVGEFHEATAKGVVIAE